jgi:hypothetical protein
LKASNPQKNFLPQPENLAQHIRNFEEYFMFLKGLANSLFARQQQNKKLTEVQNTPGMCG